eukprot:TRINITY_DN5813_c0_g1_i1.p1 TRINITY_DN5813_c0_g1~~TRINITY_DN5813_c0_g1_i1.p1  ORF type:complete len:319 (-),score=46.18 TRINITY_DN5813_c0_g1_i1:814-1770(-)
MLRKPVQAVYRRLCRCITSLEYPQLNNWTQRTLIDSDVLSVKPLQRLDATVNRNHQIFSYANGIAPLGSHWAIHLPLAQHPSPDGHDSEDSPPAPFVRRMWAEGSFKFSQPLRVGTDYHCTRTVSDIQLKNGRAGPLLFVTRNYRIAAASDSQPSVEEVQTLVYMTQPAKATAGVPATETQLRNITRRLVPDSLMLFRFSALTFNGHKIHYDTSFANNEEGYSDVLVHGPLTCTLLLRELEYIAQQPPNWYTDTQRSIVRRFAEQRWQSLRFQYQAKRPVVVGTPMALSVTALENGTVELSALDDKNFLCMTATAFTE